MTIFEEEYSRTVKPRDYESIRVSHKDIFDSDETSKDEALEICRRFVIKKINEELNHYGVEQLSFYPDLIITTNSVKPQKNHKGIKFCEICRRNLKHTNNVCINKTEHSTRHK